MEVRLCQHRSMWVRGMAAALAAITLLAQTSSEGKQRVRQIRELAKSGPESIPKLEPSLGDGEWEVRVEAVKAIVEIGSRASLEPLVRAAADADPEIQIRAVEGLVNFYYPGYVKSGWSAALRRVGSSVQAKVSDAADNRVIPAYVEARPEVVKAIGSVARSSPNVTARLAAARAVGVLRGRAAVPDLVEACRSKDSALMIESMLALQKIGDLTAGPRVAFLVRDLEERVKVTALETVGLLQATEAIPEVRQALERAATPAERRAAIQALGLLGDAGGRNLFRSSLADRDEGTRAAAAEGLGRLGNREDLPVVQQAFDNERSMRPRLSLAFALVRLGQAGGDAASPLRYLLNTLNSRAWRNVAQGLLTEAARDPRALNQVHAAFPGLAKEEKLQAAGVLAASGNKESVPLLEAMSQDADLTVAEEGVRALRSLKARLP